MANPGTDRKVRFSGSWDFNKIGHFECHGVANANTKITITASAIDPNHPYDEHGEPNYSINEGQKIILE